MVRHVERGGRADQAAVQGPRRSEGPFEAGAGQADLTVGDRLVQLDHAPPLGEAAAGRRLIGDVVQRLDAVLDTLLVVLHLGDEAGGVPTEGVGRAELDLAVHAFALLGVVVPEQALERRHLPAVAGRSAREHGSAKRVVLAHRRVLRFHLGNVVVELLERGADDHAPRLVRPEGGAGGEGQAVGRLVIAHVAAALVVAVRGDAVEERAVVVEGAAGVDRDDAADGVAVVLRGHRLHDFEAAGHHRGHDIQRHGAAAFVDRGDHGAVDGGAVISRAQTAKDREARLALVFHHRDARDTAQGGGGVVVRQLADVVGGHHVGDDELLALHFDGGPLGFALAGDDDLFDRTLLGERHGRRAQGAGRQKAGQNMADGMTVGHLQAPLVQCEDEGAVRGGS